MDSAHPRFVEVYRAANLPEAHAIRIALEEAGFPVQLDGELLQGAVGDLPMGWSTAPRILVEESRGEEARAWIDDVAIDAVANRLAEWRHGAGTRCLVCRCPIQESATSCPACGWSYGEAPAEAPAEAGAETAIAAGAPAPYLAPSRFRLPRGRWIALALVVVAGVVGTLVWRAKRTQAEYDEAGAALDAKDYDGAITHFTNYLERRPGDAAVYYYRAFAHFQKGNYDAARTDCAHALDHRLEIAAVYGLRADALARLGDVAAAIGDYTRAIELSPGAAGYRLARGYCLKQRKDYARAFVDYRAAAHLDPKNALAHDHLAWLLATAPDDEVRNGQAALEHAKEAVALAAGKFRGPCQTMAAACAELGRFGEAVEWQKKFLADPDLDAGAPDRDRRLAAARARLKGYEAGEPARDP